MTDPVIPEKTDDEKALLWAVKNYYDVQRLRLAVGNRLPKGGKAPPIHLSPEDIALLRAQRDALKLVEADAAAHVRLHVRKHPMWPWLTNVRGLGEVLAGAVLSEFNPYKARHASSFWKFAGLNVVGEGPDAHAPHPVKKQKLPYNAWLRAKLVGVIGPSFLKAGYRCVRVGEVPMRKGKPEKGFVEHGAAKFYEGISKKRFEELKAEGAAVQHESYVNKDGKTIHLHYLTEPGVAWVHEGSRYAPIYADRRHRAESTNWGRTKSHRHQHALRVMVKQFVAELWAAWRAQLGLRVTKPYREAVLGLPPHGGE